MVGGAVARAALVGAVCRPRAPLLLPSSYFGCNCDHCRGNGPCPTGGNVPSSGRRRLLAVTVDAAANTTSQACADVALILQAPLADNVARLSKTYCASGAVDEAFAKASLEILDADGDGDVDCDEWKIAKGQATAESLARGGHFGRAKLPDPKCRMSDAGKAQLKRTNAHLEDLRAAGAKASEGAKVAAPAPAAVKP